MIEVVGLDGDDTLWHSEDQFTEVQLEFHAMLMPYIADSLDPVAALDEVEHRNLELFGYGAKGFTLSMIETAIEISGGRVSALEIRRLIGLGRSILARPVELIEGVLDTIEELRSMDLRLIVVTKGDLTHQESKVAGSGLAELFHDVAIVSEKDEATYQRILTRAGVAPERFLMAGNSVKSDVLPVLAVGGRAVHIPYHVTWVRELVEHESSFPTLRSIRELPAVVANC